MADSNKTTVAAVQIDPAFADIDASVIQQQIDDTWPDVLADKLPSYEQERGNRLLVKSKLVVAQIVANGGIQSASQLNESQTMFDWSKGNDPYMIDYLELVDKYGHSRHRGRAFSRN
ncbi:hypothetical protein [Lactobacillus brevis] [Lactiplantibacillus mudanjiangensis]|uniref:hypothetical protein n=1 Tax=Lactiplantibacillus mudanjiangensis TaxID=1296538 RepID=UPI0010141935|nr:hypothetical protein [Lactobacillus brevis] [Lactiplantibacillus mudanjiangensis]